MKRQEFTTRTKRQAFSRSGGICEGLRPDGTRCNLPLVTGHITYDHRIPWEISHDSTLSNCQVLAPCCDKPKTKRDQGIIAKGHRVEARHIGARSSRTPMPFGRRDWRKKKLDGTIVDRRTGKPIKHQRR